MNILIPAVIGVVCGVIAGIPLSAFILVVLSRRFWVWQYQTPQEELLALIEGEG